MITEDRIIAYLNGQLTGDILREFEEALESDASLRQDVSLYQTMEDHLKYNAPREIALRALDEVHNEIKGNRREKSRRFGRRQILAIAAVILMLVSFSLWLSNRTSMDHQRLYDTYYSFESASFQTRGESSQEQLIKAQTAYNAQLHDEAAVLFRSYLARVEDVDPKVSYFQGLNLLLTNDTREGVGILESLAKSGLYRNDASWQLALLYLRQQKIEEAQSSLQRISADSGHYKDALELLDILGKE